MKPEPNPVAELFREVHPTLGGSPPGVNWGYFERKHVTGRLRIISSGGARPLTEGWEHVSVSLADRAPTWREMCIVKDMFWGPEETVVQFHPKDSEYVNKHPYCLHLWKKVGSDYELPPKKLIT